MADDQFLQASGNWWESAARNVRLESRASQSTSSGFANIANFAWPQDMDTSNNNSSISVSATSSAIFHDTHSHTLPPADSPTSSDPNLHIIMGLGLSSHAMDWNVNQASNFLDSRGEKASDSRFRSMFQENMKSPSTNFQQETGMGLSQVSQEREKLFSAESSSTSDQFRQVNKSTFSLDQTTQFSRQYSSGSGDSTVTTSQGLPSGFQMDSSSGLYGIGATTPSILQGLLGPEAPLFENNNRTMSFPYASLNSNNDIQLMPSRPKVPQFLRTSPPKQLQHSNNQLHFANNAPFWNASDAHAAIKDAPSSFFPSLQPPFPTPNFNIQSKNISGARDSGGVGKKSGSEAAPKRPRNETSSPLPAFKVRKEKMGDRITALQQLVSPFGKTDTASVLSEAIEYIKFLHERVTVLSTPYMKSGAPIQHQQSSGKSKEPEGLKQDLRSRGLCLVPVSSTFPVTHETTVDFWMPTFGATFR